MFLKIHSQSKRLWGATFLLALCLALIAVFAIPATPSDLKLTVPQGASLRAMSKLAAAQSAWSPAWLFEGAGRVHKIFNASANIQAGRYTLDESHSVFGFWQGLQDQSPEMISIKLQEGWTFKQIRRAVNEAQGLKHSTASLSDATLMAKLGAAGVNPEGRFFPDTYLVDEDSADLALYKAAFDRMGKLAAKVWGTKPALTPLQSLDELLILASIVEKETALSADRGLVASVFHNRLNIGMRLQTDPTVIYGMGDAYAGRIRKVDLQTDTEYNTYTRNGLPPTPIAAPSEASLRAAMNPDPSEYLYFVAKGDGSGGSTFSKTLPQHNQAVAQYLANRRGD